MLSNKMITVVKIAGMVLSVVGMVASGIASNESNKKTLEDLANKHFENNN